MDYNQKFIYNIQNFKDKKGFNIFENINNENERNEIKLLNKKKKPEENINIKLQNRDNVKFEIWCSRCKINHHQDMHKKFAKPNEIQQAEYKDKYESSKKEKFSDDIIIKKKPIENFLEKKNNSLNNDFNSKFEKNENKIKGNYSNDYENMNDFEKKSNNYYDNKLDDIEIKKIDKNINNSRYKENSKNSNSNSLDPKTHNVSKFESISDKIKKNINQNNSKNTNNNNSQQNRINKFNLGSEEKSIYTESVKNHSNYSPSNTLLTKINNYDDSINNSKQNDSSISYVNKNKLIVAENYDNNNINYSPSDNLTATKLPIQNNENNKNEFNDIKFKNIDNINKTNKISLNNSNLSTIQATEVNNDKLSIIKGIVQNKENNFDKTQKINQNLKNNLNIPNINNTFTSTENSRKKELDIKKIINPKIIPNNKNNNSNKNYTNNTDNKLNSDLRNKIHNTINLKKHTTDNKNLDIHKINLEKNRINNINIKSNLNYDKNFSSFEKKKNNLNITLNNKPHNNHLLNIPKTNQNLNNFDKFNNFSKFTKPLPPNLERIFRDEKVKNENYSQLNKNNINTKKPRKIIDDADRKFDELFKAEVDGFICDDQSEEDEQCKKYLKSINKKLSRGHSNYSPVQDYSDNSIEEANFEQCEREEMITSWYGEKEDYFEELREKRMKEKRKNKHKDSY